MIAFDNFNVAVTPSTDQIQIIGAFAANVGVTYMILGKMSF